MVVLILSSRSFAVGLMVLLDSQLLSFLPVEELLLALLHEVSQSQEILVLSINFVLSSLNITLSLGLGVLSSSVVGLSLVEELLGVQHLASPVVDHIVSVLVSLMLSVSFVD